MSNKYNYKEIIEKEDVWLDALNIKKEIQLETLYKITKIDNIEEARPYTEKHYPKLASLFNEVMFVKVEYNQLSSLDTSNSKNLFIK